MPARPLPSALAQVRKLNIMRALIPRHGPGVY